jgi:hypothetical protein
MMQTQPSPESVSIPMTVLRHWAMKAAAVGFLVGSAAAYAALQAP